MEFDYSNLKGLLASKGITQEKLAKEIGMTQATMSNKINGKAFFTQCEIRAMISFLDIPMELVGEYFFTFKYSKTNI